MNSNVEFGLSDLAEGPVWARGVFLVALFVLLQFLGYWWYFEAKWAGLEKQTQQEQSLAQSIQTQSQIAARLPEQQRQYHHRLDLIQQAERSLVEADDLPSLLESIHQIGTRHQIIFERITWGARETNQHYLALALDFELRGDFHQIARFAEQVAQLPQLIHFVDFSVSRVSPNSEALYFHVRAYIYQSQLAENLNAD
ncbi:hypothetical protein BIY22_14380 [Vibrio panuliri]|uniref:Fimbrial protein n=1 Tax=Vibrio panuliri TaxID=1381081 RepID=A0A1Q9H938_9VIBR|nr:type 4a pilus biogenesis protein PilO [Vibrio panuliri]OLQ85338.1 hypothetical protein BIY22_14380 [Vibrio panuliri]